MPEKHVIIYPTLGKAVAIVALDAPYLRANARIRIPLFYLSTIALQTCWAILGSLARVLPYAIINELEKYREMRFGAGEGNRSIEANHSLTICFIKNHESLWLQLWLHIE